MEFETKMLHLNPFMLSFNKYIYCVIFSAVCLRKSRWQQQLQTERFSADYCLKMLQLNQHPVPVDSSTLPETGNPLFNHVVMAKILSLTILTFEDVKNIRLVCTFWHNASIDYWTKNAVIKLVPNTKTRVGLSISELEKRYENKPDVKNLSDKPYSTYKVKGWKPKYDPVNSIVIPAEFSFGPVVTPTVEYLHIEQCNFTEAQKLENVVLPCLNLKELELSGNTFVQKRREYDPVIPEDKQLKHLKRFKVDGIMTLGWYQFMLHAPFVESLVFKQNSSYSKDTFTTFLMDHTQLQCRHKFKWPIKNLDLSEATGTYSDLATLRYHEFPLENLTVQFEKYLLDQRFKLILQGTAKTLKTFHIIRVNDRADAPNYNSIDFPCGVHMETLNELYMWGDVVHNLDFLRFTPNLKILHMNRSNFEKRHLTSSFVNKVSCNEHVPRIERFEENVDVVQRTVECWNNLTKQPVMVMEGLGSIFVDVKLGVGSMYTLRRWLPNLKSFGMVFTNNTFHLTCEGWPRLEEIRVTYGSVVTDDAVTAPYFLNMKSLQRFILDAHCNQGWFSDKAAHDGFLKLEKLCYLRICVSKQMSSAAALQLEEKIAQVKIIRNYGNAAHPDYDCCQRVAFIKERRLRYSNESAQ